MLNENQNQNQNSAGLSMDITMENSIPTGSNATPPSPATGLNAVRLGSTSVPETTAQETTASGFTSANASAHSSSTLADGSSDRSSLSAELSLPRPQQSRADSFSPPHAMQDAVRVAAEAALQIQQSYVAELEAIEERESERAARMTAEWALRVIVENEMSEALTMAGIESDDE
ncbi:uncharacterized protein L3040_004198 [Drepanopeziza brunnea f. sp. 'multigermtubi']|uniref:uncharacterized protein n=1 Tax=Drepanopeziza brunnea f. sp. 'multigermtubi' TaxID=698441 RepID=UPI0023959C33|nr:hypothetical protein L3040_004198 [Drepanopeziza brunnea f. sp. 'multigermtubi']